MTGPGPWLYSDGHSLHLCEVSYLNARRPGTSASVCHRLARTLRVPMDGHFDRRLLEPPLT